MIYPIIDCHTHVYPEPIAARAAENLSAFYRFSIQESGTFARLETVIRSAGMKGFFLLPVATTAPHVEQINRYTADRISEAEKDGFICAGFGCMHQDYPDFASGVAQIESLGLKGVKIHPDLQAENCDSDRFFSLYEILEKKGLCLYLHAGDERPEFQYSSPERIARVAKTFPHLKLCAAHFGGYRSWEEAKAHLWGKYENVYYDCSSSFSLNTVEESRYMTEACGIDRVMFGSDYPAISPAFSYRGLIAIGLREDDLRKILFDNAVRFSGIGVPNHLT